MPIRPRTAAPWIVGFTSFVLLIAITHAVVTTPNTEQATRLVIRQTARISLLLFSLTFSASSLLRLGPTRTTRSMMRNRRWLGLSFALSHFVHLLAIFALLAIAADFEIPTTTIVFGGLAYVFIAALAATSWNGAVARLGAVRWQRLHKAGMYYIWFIFLTSYAPRAIDTAAYIPAAVLVLGTVLLRFAARR